VPRITQRDIARLANVSQATVSTVLNNRHDATTRIAPETRERVLEVIRKTGYVADPAARQLMRKRNEIIGVFTYESVFPSTSADFYHPFLIGIEERAEELGCDLLLFTSAPVSGGARRIFHENNRLRLADGCLLLGREIPHEELRRLIVEEYPFVAIGRRDDAGGPVPYVGADYAAATQQLVEQVRELGHRQLAYVGVGEGAESAADRLRGFRAAAGKRSRHIRAAGRPAGDLLDELLGAGITAVFFEDMVDAAAVAELAFERGLAVPDDLSMVALGDPTGPVRTELDFTGFHIPRKEMGRQAVHALATLPDDRGVPVQKLLPCQLVVGQTVSAPRKDAQ
jgi:DNA-binding LacI/PurR family transcriptional regulator